MDDNRKTLLAIEEADRIDKELKKHKTKLSAEGDIENDIEFSDIMNADIEAIDKSVGDEEKQKQKKIDKLKEVKEKQSVELSDVSEIDRKIIKPKPAFVQQVEAQTAYVKKKLPDPDKIIKEALEVGARLNIRKLPMRREKFIQNDSKLDPRVNYERFKLYMDTRMSRLAANSRTVYLHNYNGYVAVRNKIGKEVEAQTDLYEYEREQMYINAFSVEKGVKLANGTIRLNPHYISFLKHFYRCFRHLQITDSDRKLAIEYPRHMTTSKYHKLKYLTILEINDLLHYIEDELNDDGMSVCVRLLFETGLRRNELMSIQRKHINMEEMCISADNLGKGGQDIEKLYFSYTTKKVLEKWLDVCPVKDYPFHLSADVVHPEHIFWKNLSKIGEEVLGKKVTPHSLRHSLAIFLRQKVTKDIEIIRKAMRHKLLTTTQIYAEATNTEVKDTIKKSQSMMKSEGLD